jgi:hypothetical protein
LNSLRHRRLGGALSLLERNRRALDKAVYRRQRAVMLTARALAVEEADRDNAKLFALEGSQTRARIWCRPLPLRPDARRRRLTSPRVAHHRQGLARRIRTPISPGPTPIFAWRHGTRPPQAHRGLGEEDARPSRKRGGARARRARCAGVCQSAGGPHALPHNADPAGGVADGGGGPRRAQRRGPRARMGGARR